MLEVKELKKSYGGLKAVDGISFRVEPGEIYGLLGPNGAGKTTTINMISGLLTPDGGEIELDGRSIGKNPRETKAKLGVVPQETALYEDLTGKENLRFWAGLYGYGREELSRKVEAALEQVGLGDAADKRAKEYSGGMKRRLNLAMGLIPDPKVILLDEPTVGIDPQARVKILDVVKSTVGGGAAVLYTTHYLEEAEMLCDRIGIMDKGRILAEGTLQELKRLLGEGTLVTLSGEFSRDEVGRFVEGSEGATLVDGKDGAAMISIKERQDGVSGFLKEIYGSQLPVHGVTFKEANLNDLFIKLTGRELRD